MGEMGPCDGCGVPYGKCGASDTDLWDMLMRQFAGQGFDDINALYELTRVGPLCCGDCMHHDNDEPDLFGDPDVEAMVVKFPKARSDE